MRRAERSICVYLDIHFELELPLVDVGGLGGPGGIPTTVDTNVTAKISSKYNNIAAPPLDTSTESLGTGMFVRHIPVSVTDRSSHLVLLGT